MYNLVFVKKATLVNWLWVKNILILYFDFYLFVFYGAHIIQKRRFFSFVVLFIVEYLLHAKRSPIFFYCHAVHHRRLIEKVEVGTWLK